MGKLRDQIANAGMNSGASLLAKRVRIDEIKKHPELESLFRIDAEVLEAIARSMRENGFDEGQPIVIWKGEKRITASELGSRVRGNSF